MPLRDILEEVVHGTVVRDPYRWLENRNWPETEEWIHDQQRRCERYFASCRDLSAIEHRVRHYLDVEVIDQPACVRDRYFYRKRAVGQDQCSICVRESAGGDERVLIDPAQVGRFTSVGISRISPDGALLGFEVRSGGADCKEIQFVDVSAGALLANRIPLGYGRGLAFSQKGYFYCQEIEPSIGEHRICYGVFGSAEQDTIVFRVPRTKGSRLVLVANELRIGARWLHPEGSDVLTDFWIADLADETPNWMEIFRNRHAPYGPILCHDRVLVLVQTESDSSQLIELASNGEEIGTFVPEKLTPIRQIAITRDRIFVNYLERGIASIDTWLLSGQRADPVDLPLGGTIQILPAHAQNTDSFFYTFESFDVPTAIYQHNTLANTSLLWHRRGPDCRNRSVDVREVTVPSLDGVQIPVTLVSAKSNQVPNGPGPVIMTTYGGFGVTLTPQFSVLASILIEMGAVFALPHVRGGGEFGKAWHDAGRARNRQASLDDFISTVEWLHRERISTPRQLAIFGGSHSGLLVGALMTQRPDLVGAVLCIAPLLDMIRYESFDQAAKWRREYGTVDDREDFQALYAYSPYHHVAEDVDYPATLFVTGDKDDRCNPTHVRKMAALLQERPTQRSPVIVDYSEERGHSAVMPLSVRIPALARRIAFLCRELEITIPNGGFRETTRC